MGIGDKLNKLKGKAKEEAGDATDNEEMRSDGRLDQTEAETKDTVDKAGNKLREGVDETRDRLDNR